MHLTPEKIKAIWDRLQKHKSLFNDLTRGDIKNWVHYLTDETTFWLEIFSLQGELVGLVAVLNSKVIDAEIHILILDNKPAEKRVVYLEILRYLFDHFPFRRLSVVVPAIYFVTIRLAEKLGFKREGTRRKSALIGGRWVDQHLYGMLREELWA